MGAVVNAYNIKMQTLNAAYFALKVVVVTIYWVLDR